MHPDICSRFVQIDGQIGIQQISCPERNHWKIRYKYIILGPPINTDLLYGIHIKKGLSICYVYIYAFGTPTKKRSLQAPPVRKRHTAICIGFFEQVPCFQYYGNYFFQFESALKIQFGSFFRFNSPFIIWLNFYDSILLTISYSILLHFPI